MRLRAMSPNTLHRTADVSGVFSLIANDRYSRQEASDRAAESTYRLDVHPLGVGEPAIAVDRAISHGRPRYFLVWNQEPMVAFEAFLGHVHPRLGLGKRVCQLAIYALPTVQVVYYEVCYQQDVVGLWLDNKCADETVRGLLAGVFDLLKQQLADAVVCTAVANELVANDALLHLRLNGVPVPR